MKSRSIVGVYWTDLELSGLLEDEDSCVHFEHVNKHLALLPSHMIDLNAAINQTLSASVNFYDPELKGLVLAYKNPKVLSPVGDVLYDTYFVHIDVEVDFYIFRPEVGRSLKGFVNKIGTNHIGVLVHKVFNVSIPEMHSENPWPDNEEQVDWPGKNVIVGQEVRFTLQHVDLNLRLPYLRGTLDEKDYLRGCHLFNEQIAATYKSELRDSLRHNSTDNNSDDKNKISTKPLNKRIFFNNDSDVEEENKLETESELKNSKEETDICQEESVGKSSRRRKRKSSHSETETDSETHEHKRRKIKIEKELIEDTNDFEFQVPKATPVKRKKKIAEDSALINDTDDEKVQKFSINKLRQNLEFDNSNESEDKISPKKHKKKSNRIKSENGAVEENNIVGNDATEENKTTENSTVEYSDYSPKKSKKRKRKSSELETENEQNQKASINDINESVVDNSVDEDSTIKNNSTIDNSIFDENNVNSLKKSKKRKSKAYEMDTDDEQNHKASLKHLIDQSVADNSATEENNDKVSKKSKKRTIKSYEMDTEDEKNYKASIKHIVTQSDINNSTIEENEDSKKKLKKRKSKSYDMDTEDEKNHKASLKHLVNRIATDTSVAEENNDLSPKKWKKRKRKAEDMDTEDEKNYKSTIKKNLSHLLFTE